MYFFDQIVKINQLEKKEIKNNLKYRTFNDLIIFYLYKKITI